MCFWEHTKVRIDSQLIVVFCILYLLLKWSAIYCKVIDNNIRQSYFKEKIVILLKRDWVKVKDMIWLYG